ncbi:C-terminal binding protein [Halosegnis marinus]|uniref:C-terminal binding protein n=1 Tax=Halosegnis marinus TaxID=3034023 RepID=A0ABD5ZS80_9EURY|nr:C-terminal binding protein [Halosegnis sp. DT85]
MSHRVVTTDGKTAEVLPEAFTWRGFDADVRAVSPDTTDALVAAAAGADALVVDAGTEVTERVFVETPVRVVARAGIGVDNIDLDAAERLGVPVVNVPDYCVEEVATHNLALLLAVWRDLRPADAAVRGGEWSRREERRVGRLSEATVGLVSFGDIARRQADLLSAFGADLLAYDPYVGAETMDRHGAAKVGFEELCRRSSAVAVHAPLTGETAGLFDADAFALLPDGAVLVNTGRGGVVDESALAAALDTGRLAGAGLDVLAEEPPAALPTDHPNVVYTPHTGWYSERAVEECAQGVAADVARVLMGREPANPVVGDW